MYSQQVSEKHAHIFRAIHHVISALGEGTHRMYVITPKDHKSTFSE